jgi:hypothetical protein
MFDPELLWYWLATDGHPSVLRVLSFLMAATVGTILASLVTWIEGHLSLPEGLSSEHARARSRSLP